jgi:hypothetical protein
LTQGEIMKPHRNSPPGSAGSFRYRVAFIGALLLFGALLLLDGCAKKESSSQRQGEPPSSTSSPSAPQTQRPANGKLTAAEIKYGIAPPRNDSRFVYEDDVVIVDHGAEAVRSLSPNGMIWTIDANAPHADEVQSGKVMFLTNRVVGRVLSAERKGDDLAVILGPIELTDVYKEAQVTVEGPLDFSSAIVYPAPYPGAEDALITSRGEVPGNGLLGRAGRAMFPMDYESFQTIAVREPAWQGSRSALSDGQVAPLPSFAVFPTLEPAYFYSANPGGSQEVKLTIHDFVLLGITDTFGVRGGYSKGGLEISFGVKLLTDKPSAFGKVDIFPGKKIDATLELRGAVGLSADFLAATSAGRDLNLKDDVSIPFDIEWPTITQIVQPFTHKIHYRFIITTEFSAKDTVLKANCDYKFTGAIHMAFHNGSFNASAPVFTPGRCLADSVKGVSLGANALTFAAQGKLIFGIGAGGFVAGPYVGYDASFGITRGSDQSTILVGSTCHSSDVAVTVDAGVGYSIPRPLVKAINFFLRALKLKEIDDTGSITGVKVPIVPQVHTSVAGGC